MRNLLFSLGIIFALIACNNEDISGTYSATLPSADGAGIETKLTLKSDSTYDLRSDFIGKFGGITTETGKWNINNNKVMLNGLSGNEYLVKDGNLVLLDIEGNEITGDMADLYILKKCESKSCNKDEKSDK